MKRRALPWRLRYSLPPTNKWPLLGIGVALLLATACDGPQSTLNPAGLAASQIATLFWWMTAVGALIWAAVFGIAVYATRPDRASYSSRATRWLIVGGGAIFPSVVLAGLLAYSLTLLPSLRSSDGISLRVAVSGEQWWWRVRYLPDSGEAVELANEIRLPVGKRVEFVLSSPDVIHSFWIPSLGGKVDMIPGRTTTLVLEATETGTFRGACAEYCGTSHALMNFEVVVMAPDKFADWLAAQAAPAQQPASALARRGRQAFLANGCGACHSIRGTEADGRLGPDLTHAGGRLSLGAGILPNTEEAFARWIGHTDGLKPEVKMPAFGMLPDAQIEALASYLNGLQ